MPIDVVEGDLLDQDVEVIVNPWNRNMIPWRLLLPQGVSGAIKRRGGIEPFKELRRFGRLGLGMAVWTGPGSLPFKGVIHVAGIDDLWRGSEQTLALARASGLESIAFPLIGAGSGGLSTKVAENAMLEKFESGGEGLRVLLVKFGRLSSL